MSLMAKGILLGWKSLGVEIENMEEKDGKAFVTISVPETSYKVDAHGNEMAGLLLIKRLKQKMSGIAPKLVISGYVRRGEHWTKEMSDAARQSF